jgi:YHS domain-containing protein
MNYNHKCYLCGASIYRSPSEEKQSKNGLFFCSRLCNNLYKGRPDIYILPKNNPIQKSTESVYKNFMNRQPEYLTDLRLHNTIGYENQLGYFLVTAIARLNNVPNFSRTPSDMEYIKSCFDNITINDILSIPEIDNDWKSIRLILGNNTANNNEPYVLYEIE